MAQSAADFGKKGDNLTEEERALALKQEREQVQSIYKQLGKSKKRAGHKSRRNPGSETSENKVTSKKQMGSLKEKEESPQGSQREA